MFLPPKVRIYDPVPKQEHETLTVLRPRSAHSCEGVSSQFSFLIQNPNDLTRSQTNNERTNERNLFYFKGKRRGLITWG